MGYQRISAQKPLSGAARSLPGKEAVDPEAGYSKDKATDPFAATEFALL